MLLQGKVDWSSCGHSNGQRCRRSTKHTTKMLAFATEIARYLLLLMPRSICITFATISSLRRTHSPLYSPTTVTCFTAICDKLNGTEEQVKRRCISEQGLFFLPVALRGKRGAKEEAVNWNFKMVLIVCTLLHSCLSSLPDSPHLYLNHTSNNDFEERGKSERQHFRAFFCLQNKILIDALQTCTIQCKIYSQICTMLFGH